MKEIKEELWQAMAECHRMTNRALAGKEVWKDLDSLYWYLAQLATKVENLEEMPQGENVVIGGQVAYKVGGFITWD